MYSLCFFEYPIFSLATSKLMKSIESHANRSHMRFESTVSVSSQLNTACIYHITKLEVDTACAYDQTPLIFCMNACFIETEQIQFIESVFGTLGKTDNGGGTVFG